MDKRRKQVKRMRKEKVKNANDEEANGQGREKGEKGYLNPMRDKNS